MPDRSITKNLRGEGGAKNCGPFGLDMRDPNQLADFLLRLGYRGEQVVTTLMERCSLDHGTAQRIVDATANTQQGGQ